MDTLESQHTATDDSELGELLRRRLAHLDHKRDELIQRRRCLDAELGKIDEERMHIAALLNLNGSRPSPEVVNANTESPADLVVRLLNETGPLHYREIERQLRARGWYQAGGVDPANTLLSKYFRDPRLYRPQRGVYAVRPEGRTVQSVGTKRRGTKRRSRGGANAA